MNQVFSFVAILLTCGALFTPRAFAVLDVAPADGIPDIWALLYNAGALEPDEDADGDGMSNAVEAAAGTNPFQPGSVVKVTAIARDDAGVHLTFPTLTGKRYQLQSSPTVANPTWANLGTALTGNGNAQTATANGAGTEKYFGCWCSMWIPWRWSH